MFCNLRYKAALELYIFKNWIVSVMNANFNLATSLFEVKENCAFPKLIDVRICIPSLRVNNY